MTKLCDFAKTTFGHTACMTDRDRPSSPPTLAGPTTLSSTTSTIPYSRLMSDNEGTGDQAEVEVETTTTTAVEKENEEKEEDPAETIKAVHASLRRRCQRLEREEEGGVEDFQEEVEDVWRSHLGEEEELQKYASAMHRLATGKWTRRRRKKKTKKRKKAGEEEVVVFDDDDLVDVPDRISWIVSHIDKYFRYVCILSNVCVSLSASHSMLSCFPSAPHPTPYHPIPPKPQTWRRVPPPPPRSREGRRPPLRGGARPVQPVRRTRPGSGRRVVLQPARGLRRPGRHRRRHRSRRPGRAEVRLPDGQGRLDLLELLEPLGREGDRAAPGELRRRRLQPSTGVPPGARTEI